MKTTNAILLALLFMAAACNASKSGDGHKNDSPETAKKNENHTIVGVWKSSSKQVIGNIEFTADGRAVPQGQPTGAGHMHSHDDDEFVLTYKFDDSRQPAWLDLIFPPADTGESYSFKAIVEFLNADKIKMQSSDIRNPERPTEFKPKDKTIYLERVK